MVAEDLPAPDQDKHRCEDDDNEEEEALSFCDLPIYSDSFKWDDSFSTRDRTSNSFEIDDDGDFFEFFSEELTASPTSRHHVRDNIVFCGKLIPYKGTAQCINKAVSSRCDRVGKVSAVASPPHTTRPRWYFYMFGLVRAPPAEMELRDMRTRQSRRHHQRSSSGSGSGSGSHSLGTFPSLGNEKGETAKRKVSSSSKRSRPGGLKGLWWLWRAVGCRSRHVENVAKAAYGAVPRVS